MDDLHVISGGYSIRGQQRSICSCRRHSDNQCARRAGSSHPSLEAYRNPSYVRRVARFPEVGRAFASTVFSDIRQHQTSLRLYPKWHRNFHELRRKNIEYSDWTDRKTTAIDYHGGGWPRQFHPIHCTDFATLCARHARYVKACPGCAGNRPVARR